MAQHPLVSLRGSVGLSHPAYARLIAETHARLGFGHMAARREKISRWESGRTVPELTAQLAMAHVHQVPGEEVERLGWPHWLHLATGDAALPYQPWTVPGALNTLRGTARPSEARPHPDRLAVTGPALAVQIRESLAALAGRQPPPARDGHRVTPDTVAWIETRTQALERHEAGTPLTPTALYGAARTEHRLITTLLTTGGYDSTTGTRLLLLATRTAVLCAWLSSSLGEEAGAERYTLAAIRAATAAGARQHTAESMCQLAVRHLIAGSPRDALHLVHAARAAAPHPTAHLAASLHIKEALALARLKDATASFRTLGHATRALDADTTGRNPTDNNLPGITLDEDYLAIVRGHAWCFLGRPRKALPHFASLFTSAPSSPIPYTARRLLHAVDSQLADGQLDAAAHSTHHAVTLTGTLPPGLTHKYRQRLAPHRAEPLIRDLLDLLADTSP
ncbi:hypothetical protein [Streptomyces sp. NPDC002537]